MSGKPSLSPIPSAITTTSSSSDQEPSQDTTAAYTPLSTLSNTPEPTPLRPSTPQDLINGLNDPTMDTARGEKQNEEVEVLNKTEEPAPALLEVATTKDAATSTKDKKAAAKLKCKKKHKHKKGKPSKKEADESDSSPSDDSSESSSDASDSSDSESSSEEEIKKSKKNKKKQKKKQKSSDKQKSAVKKTKAKKSKKSKRDDSSDSSSSDSDSSDSESEDDHAKRKRKKHRSRKARDEETSSDEEEEDSSPSEAELELDQGLPLGGTDPLSKLRRLRLGGTFRPSAVTQQNDTTYYQNALAKSLRREREGKRKLRKEKGKKALKKLKGKEKKRAKKDSKPEFKRVDQLWDSNIHDYKLTETAEEQADEFDEYVFNVRRKFDWENKYRNTVVDIKSKHLREALGEVMKDVKAISLVEHQPSIDPNMLFLYLEEVRTFYKKTLKDRLKKEKKHKVQKKIKAMISHCKLLVSYLDTDYDETKKTLFPMLKAGNITFDLLWALFKPNTQAYTTTYGSSEHPRCFKVDYANKEKTFMRGEYYCIEGRYLEYDGKNFGLGDYEVHIDAFKGPRKITSLPTFPLQYHKDPEGVKKQLVDRGKKFVLLSGMNYRFMKGLAFHKKKKNVIVKVNINGRIMIDPAIFRRINPNYMISNVKPKEDDTVSDEEGSCCGDSDESDEEKDGCGDRDDEDKSTKTKFKVVLDENNEAQLVEVDPDDEEDASAKEKLDKLPSGEEAAEDASKQREFTEEELLIASPVVLGFSFTEKAWLEFSISGVHEIDWDDGAFESLVLPPNHKSIVKAQVCSHKFHAAQTIDDVIQGKGKGLVFVLHGPPGVGKTLTAEGIAEFLRCPLYAVSAGELGTDARIEHELQKIMDIAHSWGAVLLLDEADVFLEKRQHQDVHRNALVSIFLRLLEYFQGILFLTTNRVETFDDAFQSRIHIALRYEELSAKAKRDIWKLFIERVRDGGSKIDEFREKDFEILARNSLNGRQIKNAVKCAQALAVDEKIPLSLEHIRRVLEVMESFDRHLKGGTGYLDAMRSYT